MSLRRALPHGPSAEQLARRPHVLHGRFLHADISVHRIDRPKGEKLLVDARIARRGGAFVRVEVLDEGADDLLIILGEVHVVLTG